MKNNKILLLEYIDEAWDWFSIGRFKKGLKSLEKARSLAKELVEEE